MDYGPMPSPMRWLDLTLPTPAENLACDEALLALCEENDSGPILRFWEPSVPFVVLGYSNPIATEVYREHCRQRAIPVLRRCTGGGTVLQGPGCLNYSLILPITEKGPFVGVTETNCHIMSRHRQALQQLLGQPVTIEGHTDLAIHGRKFSGNAQRRGRRSLLFHGCFLLNLDLTLVEQLLPLPGRAPTYRRHRSHRDFLVNLHRPAADLCELLRHTWQAREPFTLVPRPQIERLVASRYATREWTEKF